jgi:hypothetical protein
MKMDKTTYIQEAERQLSDCRFYEKLDSDPTLDFTQKIMRALEAMHARGHLDNKTMEYLTPEDSVVFSGMVKFSIFFK